MKLFGNKKRRPAEPRPRRAEAEPQQAVPERRPAAEPQRAAAEERKTTPERRSAAKQREEARQTAREGKGFLTMAIIALAGVILMCILLIRYSGKQAIPVQISTDSTPSTSGQPGESTEPSDSSAVDPELPVEELRSTYDSTRINFLVAGVNEENVTDTLLLAGIDLETGELSYVSVPRETYISGNYEVPMLNQVYGAAGGGERGAAALKEKFKEMFGFWVDYYLILDAKALEKAVDLAGGVTFDVPKDLDYSEAALSAGTQTLDGGQAVGLFRFRKDYDEVDTHCTEVQRDFIAALLEQAIDGKTAEELNEDLLELMLFLDTDLSLGNLNWLAQFLAGVDFDDVYHKTLLGDTITEDGMELYQMDQEDTLDVMNIHFNPTGKDLTKYDMNLRQQSGGAGDGTLESYWWQTSDTEEPTEEESTEGDPTSDSDSGSESTDASDPSESGDAPTDAPTETPTETEAPPEE